MKALFLTGLLLWGMGDSLAQPTAAPASPPAPALPLRARLTDDVIRQAVRETLAERPDPGGPVPSGDVLSAAPYRTFSRAFTEAKKPSCLGPGALKHQPAEIRTRHWVIGAGGLTALPFWAAAIARGKCN